MARRSVATTTIGLPWSTCNEVRSAAGSARVEEAEVRRSNSFVAAREGPLDGCLLSRVVRHRSSGLGVGDGCGAALLTGARPAVNRAEGRGRTRRGHVEPGREERGWKVGDEPAAGHPARPPAAAPTIGRPHHAGSRPLTVQAPHDGGVVLVHVLFVSAADEDDGATIRVRHDRRDVGDVDGDTGRGLLTLLRMPNSSCARSETALSRRMNSTFPRPGDRAWSAVSSASASLPRAPARPRRPGRTPRRPALRRGGRAASPQPQPRSRMPFRLAAGPPPPMLPLWPFPSSAC